jgi:hypothetical protein
LDDLEVVTIRHEILIGDSILDNGKYVPGESCVAEQLVALLGKGGNDALAGKSRLMGFNPLEDLLAVLASAAFPSSTSGPSAAKSPTIRISRPSSPRRREGRR